MSLLAALTPETICLNLQARTKPAVLEEMVDLLVFADRLPVAKRARALGALQDRERKMSTGMQNGIAIPHAKTDAVDSLLAVLAIHRTGLDFDALDGQPCRIFVMTLSPLERTGPHIQFLAEISLLLNEPAFQRQLLKCHSPQEALALFHPGKRQGDTA